MTSAHFDLTPYNRPFIPCRADPFILHHLDGYYYFTASVPEYDRIVLRRSRSLSELANAPEKVIWFKHKCGPMSMHIWAPELHLWEGVWYIYFAAGERDDIWKIRPYILRCDQANPLDGPWEEMGVPQRSDNFSFNDFSLDMTVFEHCSKLYTVWAEKVNLGKKISNLYIAQMDAADKLASPQMLLSFPGYQWEQDGFWVNEGPAFLPGKDFIHLTYSASATGACYCMGMLTAPADADLLDPNSWSKSRWPVLKSDANAGLYGPGHNSFFLDDNGRTIMAYHARQYDEILGDPLYDPNRHCYLMEVTWNHGTPVFDFHHNLFQ